jgi:predicted nuclease of predicted toxin-antitoxin system
MAPGDAEVLRSAGHDAVWAGTWPSDPGDPEILRQALAQGRVLVTLDRDFGALMFRHRLPHGGVLYLRNVSPIDYAQRILDAIELFGRELDAGAVVVVRKSHIRLGTNA